MSRDARIILIGALIVACLSALGVRAADDKAGFSLAFVDVQKAFKAYKKTETMEVDLKKFADTLQQQFDRKLAGRLLTEAERKELETIQAKAQPSDAEKKRIDDFTNLSKQRDTELVGLQNANNPNDQQKGRLKELLDLNNKSDADLQAFQAQLMQQLEAKKVEMSAKLSDEIRATIGKVAQEKGFTAVVDKQAIFYGGVDITEDVITSLNAATK
ncbi:MAG: OmpH family outer membrane protein [Armatimonadetes bacterium]|nr:OmpH family outer membrane protein [Armatimonadota bacterium]